MEGSFTVELQDESDLLRASEKPFEIDNTTVCKCKVGRFMCLRERGRNACPCKNHGHFCSTACHGQNKYCLNKLSLVDGDRSSSSKSSVESNNSDEDFEPPQAKQPKRGTRGSSRRGRGGRSRADSSSRGSGGEAGTSSGSRSGRRGCGRLTAEANSEERQAGHEDQIQELINGLNEGAVRNLAIELLRRQPAVFADLVNGQLPNVLADIPPPQGNPGPPGNPRPPEDDVPDWCKCGLCIPMPTPMENKCCTQSVCDCITTNPLFYQIVLDGNILDVAMRYREDILADEHPQNNENFRHAAYRQFVLWQHGRLGQGNRRVVPSCCVKAIRNRYPSPNGIYVGFRPTRL